jgi:hypothetical protein
MMTYPGGVYSTSFGGGKAEFGGLIGREIYVGHWVKWKSDFIWNPVGTKIDYQSVALGQTALSGSTAAFTIRTDTLNTRLAVDVTIQGNGQFVGIPHTVYGNRSTPFVAGQTYWLEYHVKLNDVPADGLSVAQIPANGILEVWIDDVLWLTRNDLRWTDRANQTWKTFFHAAEWGGGGGTIDTCPTVNPGLTHVMCGTFSWIDHTVIATTRIGKPGGGGITPDTTPPTAPANLLATASGASASITWSASTDNIGVSSYSVLRCPGNGCTPLTVIATVGGSTTSYIDGTIAAGLIYVYSVKAVDAAGNFSAVSNTSQITAPTVFRRTLFTDDFNRADTTGDIGAAWDSGYTARNNLGITSNAIRTIATGTVSLETFNTTGAIGDQWHQARITSMPSVTGSQTLVMVRSANAPTESFYACRVQADTPRTQIEKRTTGTGVTLQSTAAYDAAWVAGDRIRCEATGSSPTTIKFYRIAVNGTETLVLSDSSDSSFATGKAGLRLLSATSVVSPEVDDVAVGDFQAVVSSTAPTVDAVSNSAAGNTTNSLTWTHTVGSGTNRLLAVCLAARDNATAGDVLASTVTANGLALTKAKEQAQRVDDYFAASLWYLVNPGVGVNTIVATWGGPPSGYGVGSSISIAGVDQANPIDATSSAGGIGVTASTSTTTVADHAMIVDCAQLRANPLISIGGSQTARVSRDTTGAIDTLGISTVNDKTPAGAQATTWTQSSSADYALAAMSLTPASVTPVIEPTIVGMVVDPANTGVNLTFGPTTPSWVRFSVFTDSGALPPVISTVPIASFTAGRYDTVFPAGYDGVCAYPINAVGVENSSQSAFYRCVRLEGIVPAIDTTPATMTQVLPSGTLNQGTTSTTFVVTTNKLANMRWDTSSTTYDQMNNAMNCASLTCSASTGNILSNGTTTHIFTCTQFTNTIGNNISCASALDVPITVAAGAPTDTTAPTAPSNVTVSLLSQSQVKLAWTASTDAVGVTGYQSFIDTSATCANFVPIGLVSVLTETIQNLQPNSTVSFIEKALDAAGNISAASNCVIVTTTPLVDTVPPDTMANLTGLPFSRSVVLSWDRMLDNTSSVTAIIERCQGAGCTNFAVVSSQLGESTVIANLTPATAYRFRGIGSDGNNLSVSYSPIIDITTKTSGLDRPRSALRFTEAHPSVGSRPVTGARTPVVR